MPFAPVRTAAPDFAALTLAEAKEHLELDHNDHNDFVTSLIATATEHLEGENGILSMTLLGGPFSWKHQASGETCVKLPQTPIRSLEGATIGGEAVVSATLENRMDGDYVRFASPQTGLIKFEYTAGFENAAQIPAPLKHAMKLHIGSLHEHRETELVGTGTTVNSLAHYKILTDPYRRRRIG